MYFFVQPIVNNKDVDNEIERPDIFMTCCFTGHRPNTFPWKNNTDDVRCKLLLDRIENAIDTALSLGIRNFICGNALGVDTWAAEIILKKKEQFPDIFLELALPFESHNCNVTECIEIQKKADLVHTVSTEKCIKSAYFKRNKYMVEHSQFLIAVYDDTGGKIGGTKWTFDYAKEKGLKIIQVPWCDIV